jgi:hypothetical protein
MYVVQTQACSVPNSRTPLTPAQLASSAQAYSKMNAKVAQALASYASVLNRPDLNRNGHSIKEQGGVPAAPFAGVRAWPDWTEGNPAGNSPACVIQQSVPAGLPTNSPETFAPPAPPMAGLTTQSRSDAGPASDCSVYPAQSTGNVCLDLKKGRILQSQISQKQLIECATKGYSGLDVTGRSPALARFQTLCTDKLPKIPDQPNVPQYDQASMGMAGVADGLNTFALWASLGLMAASVWLQLKGLPKGLGG